MSDLRCLTLKQPYASQAAHGIKRWETRSRRTNWRGPVAIHAAARDTDNDPSIPREAWDALGDCIGGDAPVRGAVVAVADLTDSIPIESVEDETGALPRIVKDGDALELCEPSSDPIGPDWFKVTDITDQLPLGFWTPGNWAWRLDNVRRLPKPIPAKGRLGLWRPDDDLAGLLDGEGGLT